MFDIAKITEYREGNRFEAKKAQGGLLDSVWSTYSAYANTDGGVILLGALENGDGSLNISGVSNPGSLIKAFWDTVNNRSKVNVNILRDGNVYSADVDGKSVVVIETPRANRQDKPVYINGNLFGGTYRRNGEGDYRCTESEVKNMLRDSGDITQDRVALDSFSMGALNTQTVTRYRMRFSNLKPNHVWADIFPEDFLLKIGAAKRSGNDGELHPTAAGLSNPGALRISKDEAMGGGISDPRNSALFLMFSLVGIGERAGSGLMNIEAVWKEENLPEPTLAEQFNPDRTIFTLPVHVVVERKDDSVNVDEIVSVNENVHVNTGKNVHVNENVQENVSVKLTKTEKRLLEIIQKNGKLTSIKLSESAGKDLRTITRGLRKLRENNLIERIGSDKTGVWKVIKSQ